MLLCLVALWPVVSIAQATADSHLLGSCSLADLQKEPYAAWFTGNYTDYTPNEDLVKQLKNTNLKTCSVSIFFGTWCGDSRRELPRFIKLWDALGLPHEALNLVAVSSADSLYKQSPGHEERGKHIYRVPTFILSVNGRELSRLVEYPAVSLERDLLNMLSTKEYRPNYPSYTYLSKWFDEGILTDENVALEGLANQIRGITLSSGELNSFARTLLSSSPDYLKAVLAVSRINCDLYPDAWQTHARLAELLYQTGEYRQAADALQRAIEVNNEPKNVESLLKQYCEAMRKTEGH
jgi:tetratricopeptide (TPR) repeat protein